MFLLLLQSPVTSDLEDGNVKIICNAILFVHVLVAYLIEINILTTACLNWLAPAAILDPETRTSKLQWFFTTAVIITGGFVLSNLIPFFGDLMSLLGSLCSVAATYIFPALFTLKLLGDVIPPWERRLLRAIVPVAFLIAITGVYSSCYNIYRKWTTNNPPFSC